VLGGSPADFGKLISDETKKWGKVIVAANIKSNWHGNADPEGRDREVVADYQGREYQGRI